MHRFEQNTSRKIFNSFVESVVDPRRAGDEKTLSKVVAETMKLLGNNQIFDRSKYTRTEYLADEKTHKCIKNQLFMRLTIVAEGLELVKSTIEHCESNIVGFFIRQYAKWKRLELY